MDELVRRIAVTVGLLLVVRLGGQISIPGVDITVWDAVYAQDQGGALAAANTASGGAIARLSIFALGLVPYLSAAVLVQITTVVFGGLRDVARRGEAGRRRIVLLTLVVTLLLATIQSIGITIALNQVDRLVTDPGSLFVFTATLTFAAGSLVLAWLAEQITRYGIGNGIVMILFVGVAGEALRATAMAYELDTLGVISTGASFSLVVVAVVLVFAIAAVERAQLRLPVHFGERKIGDRTIPAQDAILPFKLNNAGFLPALVAPWFFYLPLSFLALFVGSGTPWLRTLADQMKIGQVNHMIFNTVVIVILTYVYTASVVDPDHCAEQLKRYGGTIAGVEPGEATADYIDRAVSRTTGYGAVYLALVYLIPELLVAYMQLPFFLGGASALIAVGTVIDLDTQVHGLIAKEQQAGG
jgi:preprotein translocase subunit SecY